MKQVLFVVTITVLTLFSSCSKDTTNSNVDVIGNWIWKSGFSSGGFTMVATDTTKILSLQLKSDYSFINQTDNVIGGATEGNYQIQNFENGRIIILKSENTWPDTIKLSVANSKMTLSKTNNDYTWNYYFDKQ